ncbi:AI-2E family transporter [Mucilaginibacter gotjawali]|uniref:PurR-regulated permease PerM n=1 Tax=Mucilaginibacter gotjawali TaxID=1550579 RepID=A0A839SJU8_9SPHI|nr:AI-2E family transporter [Mucilaginibacter gotjawali]MBB3056767.1 putative PurR-regulated permease PerM [Mucilaginibacter gotjawali]
MTIKPYPFYIKATAVLIGLYYLVNILNLLSGILIPFAFAVLFSVLLNPVYSRLLRFKMPRALAVTLTVLVGISCTALIGYLLSTQVAQFGQSFPILKVRYGQMTDSLEHWISFKFGVSIQKQVLFFKNAIDSSQAAIASILGTVFGTLSLLLIIPIYVFMLLLYKNLILNFLYEVFLEEHSKRVGEVLAQTKSAIQSYIVGLLVEMVIVSSLNSLALFVIGIKYAILLGVIGGIINILPYIGGFVAILLPVIIATVTKDGYSAQVEVIVAYLLIQFVDSNIIFPRFVSIKVQINALVSLLAVFLGNLLWGIAGMFLMLPIVAVLKIIFDRVEDLKPWGKLLGDEVPVYHMGQVWGRRGRKKKAVAGQPLSVSDPS